MSLLNGTTEKRLNALLRKMAKLQNEISERSEHYKVLQREVFPLVESAGDRYAVDGITAKIRRGETWKVNALKLLERFGEKVHPLLTVSVSKFRNAMKANVLGREVDLKDIAKLVEKTPEFLLSQRK